MKRQPITKHEVRTELERKLPGAVVEDDKEWLWITAPDLGPVHQIKGGCRCETCSARAVAREIVKAMGFAFSFKPHPLASGRTSRWGHSCAAPTPFRRNGKGGNKPKRDLEPERQPDDFDIDEAKRFFEV
jgi:hypothetical protein